jgi:two-component sensor histidine kinase
MGLAGRKGMITVRLSMQNKTLVCTVDDDGIGRARSEAMKESNSSKQSRGIALAMERLKIINNLQSASCQIRISDLYPDRKDTGTHVEIEMPVQQR